MTIQSAHSEYPPSSSESASLSCQQERLWILDQLEHTGAPHSSKIFVRLKGALDRFALEQSISAVIARHRILSYRFILGEKAQPCTIWSGEGVSSLDFLDLTHLPETERSPTALKLAAERIQQGFDLDRGPLIRAGLCRIAAEEHLLAVAAHQIVCDVPSLELLIKQAGETYSALVSHHEVASAAPPYDEYTAWQREYLNSNSFERDLAYWKHHLATISAGLELPGDHPRPAVQSFRGDEQSVTLAGELFENLKAACNREQQSLFVFLLTAFIGLLHRYTSLDEVVLGTELASRNAPGTEQMVGPLSNLLVLRADCSGDPSFRSMLQRSNQMWAEAQNHQDFPFGVLLENLHVARDMSRSPVFQIMFSSRSAFEPFTAASVTFEPVPVKKRTETFDLAVTMTEHRDRIEINFSYSTDLFESSTIARMLGHFENLVRGGIEDSNQAISALPLLTPGERQQILLEWNDTYRDYPTDVALSKYIEDQVERTPDAIALVDESEKLTYRQLNNRANQVAHRLRKLGVGPDVLVGVCAERSVEMVVALLGTMKAGGAYIPIDPEYPTERLKGMLEDAQPPVVLTQERLLKDMPRVHTQVICLDRDWNAIATESVANPGPTATGGNLAYLIYTSGSTGRPKGVPNVHSAIVNHLLWMQETCPLKVGDRFLQKTPYSFDVSVWELFWPLMSGACLVMTRPGAHKDPSYLVDTISKHRITALHFVPSMLTIFLESEGLERCGSVRRVFTSGEALPYELQQRFFDRFDAELHNLYGPTETAVHVTYWRCRRNSNQPILPIGRPIANTQAYILDAELNPVPIGMIGQLHIGGRQLARGYLNRPELTAEKFIPDPFSNRSDARLYRTGDLARFLPDGNIEYLGRIDNQVKLRGFRIELGEIESVLSEFPGVRQAVVLAREDVPGDKRLVAYLALTGCQDLDRAQLRSELKRKLPEFMVPSSFVFVQSFPMTTSGKVDRKALSAPPGQKSGSKIIAPRSETEALVVSLFERVLNVHTPSITDDFFDLGGNSLLAARLLLEIQRQTGKHISLDLLFRGSSPEHLARIIEQGIGADTTLDSTVMLIQDGGSSPPFFAVVPPGENAVGYIKLARLMGHEQPFYKLQAPGPLLVGRPYTWGEMDALAQKYVDALHSVQSEGPYFIGGMCDGAHLAIRIAKKLEDIGERIGMLAIFDTWVLENSQRRWAWRVSYYTQRLRELSTLGLKEQLLEIWRHAVMFVPALVGRPRPPRPWLEAYWPGKNYVPPSFKGRVTLFKRPKQPYFYKPDPAMGWRARALGGVDIEVLPIDHAEMLHEPSVRVLADRLRTCLQQINSADYTQYLNAPTTLQPSPQDMES